MGHGIVIVYVLMCFLETLGRPAFCSLRSQMIQTPSESPFFRVLLTRPKDLQIRFGESCIGDALLDIGVTCVPFCLCMYLFVLVRIDVLLRIRMFLPFARHSILKNFGLLGPAWTEFYGGKASQKNVQVWAREIQYYLIPITHLQNWRQQTWKNKYLSSPV